MEFLATAIAGSIGATIIGAVLIRYDLGLAVNAVIGLIGGALVCKIAGLFFDNPEMAVAMGGIQLILILMLFGAIGGAVLLILAGMITRTAPS